jgi:hypothetical protein
VKHVFTRGLTVFDPTVLCDAYEDGALLPRHPRTIQGRARAELFQALDVGQLGISATTMSQPNQHGVEILHLRRDSEHVDFIQRDKRYAWL